MTRTPIVVVIAALATLHGAIALAQADRSRVMGTVIDTSGGALPGVTVTLTGSAIKPTDAITDGAGRYVTLWVPPGTYNIAFALSGFESRTVTGVKLGGGQTLVLDQQLPLAQFSETVEVKAPPPAPPPPLRVPPPPKPKFKPVEELLASVCGPRAAPGFSLAKGKIISHRDDSGRELLGPGDYVRIDAGENQDLAPGQSYVIRRRFQTGDKDVARKDQTFGEQTSGLVQIMTVQPTTSTGIVVYACSEIYAGDTIEPYVAQPARMTVSAGKPDFESPAKVAFGEYDRTAAAAGQMMVIDRGMMQGVQRGQRATIFRRRDDNPPVVIGEGMIVGVRPDSSTLRIDQSTDAIVVGDLVALHK